MAYRLFSIILLIFLCSFSMPLSAQDTKESNSIRIDGITDEIIIYRDKYATPYVIAKNEQDLIFAHGYMQAMDRLFQLEGIRRLPQGRISEIVGRDYIGMDVWFRRIGLARLAHKQLAELTPETRQALESFSAGVNAYIENCETFSVEFTFLGHTPEPWTPYDSLTVMNLISWWLSIGMYQEEFYYDLAHAFGEDMASKIFQGIPPRTEIDNAIAEMERSRSHELSVTTPLSGLYPHGPQHGNVVRGTNAWVLMGDKTADNKPILANDPHLNFFSPSIWYEIGLFCPEWSSVGVVFPGLPYHQIGTNGHIAWGAANFPVDVQDVYIHEVNPDNKHQYKFDGKWLDYTVHKDEVHIKNGNTLIYEFLESVHGPVIRTLGARNYALAWSGFDPSDSLITFHNMVRARNVDEFYESLRNFRSTPQHFFAFDLDGNIIHVQPGLIPIRDGFNGDHPNPGNSSDFLWSGYYPYDEIPVIRNPIEGFVNNSNNFPPENWGLELGTTFPLPARHNRTREILLARDDFTFDDMVEMQMDVLNPVARDLLPLMLSKINEFEILEYRDEIMLLKNWDYKETPDSIAATIFNEWWIELPKHLFNQKLGILAVSFRDYTDQSTIAMMDILENGEESEIFHWLELRNEANLRQLCILSFRIAMKSLEKEYGEDRSKWEWGRVHKAFFSHPAGIKLPFLGIGKGYGVGGGRYTLNVTHFFPSKKYDSDFGASYRIVASVDENNRIYAKSVIPPGNGGYIGSPHANDQINMWINGELKKLYVYEDELKHLNRAFTLLP